MTNSTENFLKILESTIADRLENPSQESYTANLAASGTKRVAQKVGEEAVELALASVAGDRSEVLNEAADLVYHLLVLLNTQGIRLSDVSRYAGSPPHTFAKGQDRHTRLRPWLAALRFTYANDHPALGPSRHTSWSSNAFW